MPEGANPTRRYKWFRPRQAARGIAIQNGGVGTYAQCSLYNNSGGAYYLILRAVSGSFQSVGGGVDLAVVVGSVGTLAAAGVPLVPDGGVLAGQMFTGQLASKLTNDFFIGSLDNDNSYYTVTWNHEFPLAVLPPGWSAVFFNDSTNQGLFMSLLWEAVTPDELDFIW